MHVQRDAAEMSRDGAAEHARLQQVHAAAKDRQFARAAELARSALADGIEHPLLYNVVAAFLEEQGRPEEAETVLWRGLKLMPSDPSLRNALGLCLLRLSRPAEALVQFESLLAHEASMPFIHASRGAALLALARPKDAEAAYRRALDLDPQQPVALSGLAGLAAGRGAYPAARSWAHKALAVAPGYPDAELNLARTEVGERNPAAAEERIRALLARGRLGQETHAQSLGVLGDALDAQAKTAAAFEAYCECNGLLKDTHAARFAQQVSALDYANALQHQVERALPQWRSRMAAELCPAASAGHIFLLGFPRSGTTLLELILEGHPEVVSLEERELLIDGVNQFMQTPTDLQALSTASPATLEALRASYWRLAEEGCVEEGLATPGARIFLDKHPLNTLKLPLIALLFPRAKILFACRDPRDIVLSCFRHRFRMSAPVYELLTLDGAARYYDAVMRLMVCFSGGLPLDICLVRHEDVVAGFSREMKRICDFLGIEWAPAMGDFALRTQTRGTITPSTAQLVKGLSTEGVGHWRRYREQLAPVLPLLAPWVKRFYYEQD